jgi:uncharacterized repeat protein (TIGR01451 family)
LYYQFNKKLIDMTDSTHSTKKTLLTAMILFAVSFLGNIAQAQGFLKTYLSPVISTTTPIVYSGPAHMLRTQIYENQSGYTLVGHLTSHLGIDPLKHFSVRQTDLKGVETQDIKTFDLVADDYKFAGINQTTVVLGEALDTSHISLTKNDLNGTVLWQKAVEIPRKLGAVTDTKISATGEIFVSMLTIIPNVPYWVPSSNTTLSKFDADGNLLWTMDESNSGTNWNGDGDHTLTPAKDGGCFLHHGGRELYHTVRIAADGVELWHKTFNIAFSEGTLHLQHATEVGDGGLMVIGLPSDNPYSLIGKSYAPDGTIIWDPGYIGSALRYYNYWPGTIIGNDDGSALIVGRAYKQGRLDLIAAKIAVDGTVLWLKTYDDFAYQIPFPEIASGIPTSDGGYLLVGTWNSNDILLKIDAYGNLHSNLSVGAVASDQDLDCTIAANDVPLPKAILSSTGNGSTFWAVSDSAGKFSFQADTGNYVVKVLPPSYLWEACADSILVNFADTGLLKTVDFPLQSIADCPMMTVDIYTPRLRRCFQNYVGVNYCNLGSTVAENAEISITMDAGLDFNSASIANTQVGQQITFPVGNVAVGKCGTFNLFVTPNCDSTVLGQTLCLNAHVTPDVICGTMPNWSGASIEVAANCEGDSVKFTIKNTGNAPSSMLDYVILDDHVIMNSAPFQLDIGGQTILTSPADGHTKRIICEQEPGHPVGNLPSIGIEACGTNLPSQGFLSQFPNQTGSPFDAMVCREIVGSFDPNDKTAAPSGVGSQHFIENNTEIEYLINFQNTGSDTAFTVVIFDTLSAKLDLTSIKGVSGSHGFEMKISGDNALRFVFDNIMLPDSNVNEDTSHGFIRFKIKPRAGLEDGNVIENKASIYFDFNLPIVTNTVFHTIGRDFLSTSGFKNLGDLSANKIQVSPNPSDDMVLVSIDNQGITSGICRVMDCFGKVVTSQNFDNPVFNLKRKGLPAGIYFLEIISEKEPALHLASKVIWK